MFYFIAAENDPDLKSRRSFKQAIKGEIEMISSGLYVVDTMYDENTLAQCYYESFGDAFKILVPPDAHLFDSFDKFTDQRSVWALDSREAWLAARNGTPLPFFKPNASLTGQSLVPLEQPPKLQPRTDFKLELLTDRDTRADCGAFRLREAPSWDDMVDAEGMKENCDKLVAGIIYRQAAKELGLGVSTGHNNIYMAGPSGAGKTTMAKMVALELSRHMHPGFEPSAILIATNRLIGRYIGYTSQNTHALLKACQDEVLVLDELDKALDSYFGMELIGAIVSHSGQHINRPLIIATGYASTLDQLLKYDEGLASRFPNIVHLGSQSDATLEAVFTKKAQKDGYRLAPGVAEDVARLICSLRTKMKGNFGNAREIDNLWDKIINNRAFSMVKNGLNAGAIAALSAEPKQEFKRNFATIRREEIPEFDPKTSALTFKTPQAPQPDGEQARSKVVSLATARSRSLDTPDVGSG